MSDGVAILLAGGSGQRMRGAADDKVLIPLLGKPAILHSFAAFADSGVINRWVIVFRDQAQRSIIAAHLPRAARDCAEETITWVPGGKERQDSVLAALRAVRDDDSLVMIHDAARPLVTAGAIRDVARAARADGAAVLAHPVVDTIRQLKTPGSTERVTTTELDRARLWAMETPQAFRSADICRAYEQVSAHGLKVTDDAAAHLANGGRITLVANTYENRKLTQPEDISVIEALLRARA